MKVRLVVLLALVAVVAGVLFAVTLLPRHYVAAEHLAGVTVFWHEDEAFVFIGTRPMARSTNAALDRIPTSGWAGTFAAMYADWRPLDPEMTAYHVAGRTVERHDLVNPVMAPAWDLEDGRIAARPRAPADKSDGFRW